MMKQLYKRCDTCEGRGYVWLYDFEHGLTSAGIDTNTAVCTKCKGSGFLETDLFIDDDDRVTHDFLNYITPCT